MSHGGRTPKTPPRTPVTPLHVISQEQTQILVIVRGKKDDVTYHGQMPLGALVYSRRPGNIFAQLAMHELTKKLAESESGSDPIDVTIHLADADEYNKHLHKAINYITTEAKNITVGDDTSDEELRELHRAVCYFSGEEVKILRAKETSKDFQFDQIAQVGASNLRSKAMSRPRTVYDYISFLVIALGSFTERYPEAVKDLIGNAKNVSAAELERVNFAETCREDFMRRVEEALVPMLPDYEIRIILDEDDEKDTKQSGSSRKRSEFSLYSLLKRDRKP